MKDFPCFVSFLWVKGHVKQPECSSCYMLPVLMAHTLPCEFWKFTTKQGGSGQTEVKKSAKVQADKIIYIPQRESPLNGRRLPDIKQRFDM